MSSSEREQIAALLFLRGMLQPMSRLHALDPFAIKLLSKLSLRRIIWTAQSRMLELIAKLTYAHSIAAIREMDVTHRISDRGLPVSDTAVTSCQRDLLLRALVACNELEGDVVEIGSYRGVTTRTLACATRKKIYAIDPYIGYGGAEVDFQIFLDSTKNFANVEHMRKTSGDASRKLNREAIAFVFIDAVHDFSNSWFDFSAWSRKLGRGGLIALHDVDDFPGVTMTCLKAARFRKLFSPWGYCPNLIIFERI